MLILEEGEDFNKMWGWHIVKVTREEIDALLSGKRLYFDDGEYAHILVLDEGE